MRRLRTRWKRKGLGKAMEWSQRIRGRELEVEVEELGQNNKEYVSSTNTFKVGLIEKIEDKVEKERIGGGHGGARGGRWLKRYPKGKNLSRQASMDPNEIPLGAVRDG